MELCERLTALRKKAGLSQEKLAEMLNISRQAVSKWENGTSSPDIHNIIQLGKLYDVSTDYILLGTPQKAESSDNPNSSTSHVFEKQHNKSRLQTNGFIWLCLIMLSILALYFVTNWL